MNPHQLLISMLESSAALALFTLIYVVFLKRLTHFQWTRYYLLTSIVFSLVTGFTNVEVVEEIVVPAVDVQQTNLTDAPSMVFEDQAFFIDQSSYQLLELVEYMLLVAILLGGLFFTIRFMIGLIHSWRIAHQSEEIETGIRVSNRFTGAFSFFKTVFVPSHFLELSPKDFSIVLDHERAHIKYQHTIDLLLLEGFKMVFWFNPIYWWIAKEIKLVHEYQVDAEVKDSIDPNRYAELLIQLSTKQPQPLFVQPFSMQSLSFRIKKMHQSKSSVMTKLYYSLMLPALLVLLQSFSFKTVQRLVFESQETISTNKPSFISPIRENQLTRVKPYGHRIHPITSKRQLHKGIDFVAPPGVDVLAAAKGEVIAIQYSDQGYGNQIKIEHANGYITSYSHLQEIKVVKGQEVLLGDVIASNGSTGMSTGPHCHFELILGDTAINPLKFIRTDLSKFLVQSEKAKSTFTVYVDAGHGGEDFGNVENRISEKEINAAFAEKLQ